MKHLSLMALLIAILSAMAVVPRYVAAQGCDPSSGCCGAGPSYVGQQLFAVPGAPSQVTYGPTPLPRQTANAAKAVRALEKAPPAQVKAAPAVVPQVPQFTAESMEVLTFSRTPYLGSLW